MHIELDITGDIVERQELLNGSTILTLEGASLDGVWTMNGLLGWNIGTQRDQSDGGEGDLTLVRDDGSELFATLSQAGLIDDYRFLIAPTAIGRGKAMFGSLLAPLHLRLTGTRTFSSGSVLLEYVPAT